LEGYQGGKLMQLAMNLMARGYGETASRAAAKIGENWGIPPGNSFTEVVREAERAIPPIGEGGCETGQAIGEYAAIRMDGVGGVRRAMGIVRSSRTLRDFAS
jgi:hypothetical protein